MSSLIRIAARPGALRLAAIRNGRGYHQNIIDHYETPRNVGSMDKNDPHVGTGLVGAPACGDVMKLQLRVGADGKVEDAVFKVRSAQSCTRVRCAQLLRPPLSRKLLIRSSSLVLCTDIWLWLSDCELVFHDGMAEGKGAQGGRRD